MLQVDDYTPAIKHWDLPPNADSRLDSPRYIYFGRNGSQRLVDLFVIWLKKSGGVRGA